MTYQLSPWNLKDLFTDPNGSDLEAAFQTLEEQVSSFEGLRQQLKNDLPVSNYLEILRDSEETTRLASKLYSYAELAFAADTQNQSIQALLGRIRQFLAELENRTLFFQLWWKDLDEVNANRLMEHAGDYRYYLEEMRQFKPHTLSEPEEKIINLKNITGSNALVMLYDAITNRFVFRIEAEGRTQELTRGELMVFARNHDPELRAKAYQELYRVYGENGAILGQMYQTRVRDWHNENLSLRKFASPISARNLGNDIPDQAVEALLKVCRQNASIFQRFFRLKAKLLGLEKLRRYDIYAPVSKSMKTYSFSQAAEIIFESFSAFQPEFADLARRVFDQDHLDSEVRKGKQGGAFCASVTPELTPWVKLNFQGRAEDVATMAHELGHAIHAMLAQKHTAFTFHSSLPLAETASTFGEMMLVDKLLASETDENVRRDLLFRQVDDAYATILRQAFFAIFEKQAHAMVMKNASVDEISAAYMENLKEQFGDTVELSEEFKWEWVSIPHIYHTPFYVYAYAFGQLLVFSLYQQFKAQGETFKPRYINMLAAGGSKAPAQICKEADIDINSEEFWQGGFDVLNRMVSQLEQI
jgi:oligoendopeptidase F